MGVAVSGGGDSTALLHLLSRWCNENGGTLLSVSVDHGIRPEAVKECARAERLAAVLGHEHTTLTVEVKSGGNLQRNARNARYEGIAAWASQNRIDDVFLGHTQDDQAETVFMNLARGSGVDGLAGMAESVARHGVGWHRPLLGVRRGTLRIYLKKNKVRWSEDPSNRDAQFLRVKVRELLDDLGLSVERLAETGLRMQEARAVLDLVVDAKSREIGGVSPLGEVLFTDEFWYLRNDTRYRMAAKAIGFVAGTSLKPRLSALVRVLDGVRYGKACTLSGCLLVPLDGSGFRVQREAAACRRSAPVDKVWDGRWRLTDGTIPEPAMIGALGARGLQQCPDWKRTGYSRTSLIVSPALWSSGELIAAPFAGLNTRIKFELTGDRFTDHLPCDRH